MKVFADDSIVLSIDNLKDIMVEQSIDMKIADNNYEDSKQNVEKLKDQISDKEDDIDTAESALKKLEDQLSSLQGADDPDTDAITSKKSAISSKKSEIESLESQLKTLKYNKKKSLSTLQTAEISYDSKVQSAVYSAQKSYIDYLSTISDIKSKKEKLELKQKQAEVTKLKYENGFIAKKEYDEFLRDNTDISNELNELKNKESIALKNLKFSLGISEDEEIQINDDIEMNFNKVASINYQNDLAEMIANNKELKSLNINLDWMEYAEDYEDRNSDDDDDDDDYINYDMENQQLSIEKQTATSKINFNEKYNTLMNSYNSIKASYDKLKQDETDYAMMSKKYSFGFISKKEVDESELNLNSTYSSFVQEKNKFYVAYLDYLQMKEGY